MLNGKFVLVALSENVSNGVTYYKATVEMNDRVVRVGVDKLAYESLKGNKYKTFDGVFEIGETKYGMFCSLKDAALVSSK